MKTEVSVKNVFTPEENELSWNEGWSVFHTGKAEGCFNLWELQAVAEIGSFENDDKAIEFVFLKAEEDNNSIYGKAIKFLIEESPNEIDSIFRDVIGSQRLDAYLNLNNYQIV